jgi:plastocyanin
VKRAKLCIATVTTVAFAAVVGAAGAPAEPAQRATPKVTVADDYFAPDSVKVKQGKKVKWVWDELNGNPHNVRLTDTKPEGVKKNDFKSPTATVNQTFAAKFKKTGKYGFKCSIHPTVMKMTVQVKKN